MNTCVNFPFISSIFMALFGSMLVFALPSDMVSEPTAEIFLIENVQTRGGVEVFPQPERTSGRLFAASSNFLPYVGGINEDGDWLWILYFDGNQLKSGWSPTAQIILDTEQLDELMVIDAANLPELPEIEFDELAVRPYGVSRDAVPTDAPTNETTEESSAPPPSDTACVPDTDGEGRIIVVSCQQRDSDLMCSDGSYQQEFYNCVDSCGNAMPAPPPAPCPPTSGE